MSCGLAWVQRRLVGLWWGVAVLLAVRGSDSSSSSHSMRYFYMGVSELIQGLPQFIVVGYVNDQPISRYDSIIKRAVPGVPWMEKVEAHEAGYWEGATQNMRSSEAVFRTSLEILRTRYNQSHGGLHIWQRLCGCEVWPDGQFRGGCEQYAYDGEDFIALDRETLTWTAPVPQALPTKSRWEDKLRWAQRINAYLERECVESLRKYLDYGRETLLRTEAPTGRVTHKVKDAGLETLVCHLYGFYPKEIEVTWRKGGEVRDQDTFHGGIVPNFDGTYHTWHSVDIDPKERGLYRCHVEHDSLQKPLDLAWKEPAIPLEIFPFMLIFVGVILALSILTWLIFFLKKRQVSAYRTASGDLCPFFSGEFLQYRNSGLILGIVGALLAVLILVGVRVSFYRSIYIQSPDRVTQISALL